MQGGNNCEVLNMLVFWHANILILHTGSGSALEPLKDTLGTVILFHLAGWRRVGSDTKYMCPAQFTLLEPVLG